MLIRNDGKNFLWLDVQIRIRRQLEQEMSKMNINLAHSI